MITDTWRAPARHFGVNLQDDSTAFSLLWLPGSMSTFGAGRYHPPVLFRLDAGRRTGVHVLMIEDDPAIADMYRMQLEHDGYRVSVASTGEVGFASVSGDGPDIVLLDLLLPDRSGFEVLRQINERLPGHPPVVILSNYGEPSMLDRGLSLGAVEYLVKSRVTPADVSGLIPGWIEQSRREDHEDS